MLDFLISKVQATNCLFLHASLSCVQFPVHGCLRNTICIGCCGSWETKTGGDWGQPEGRRKGICSIHLGSVLTPSKPRLWKGSSAKAEAGYSGEGEVWVGTLCTARVCVPAMGTPIECPQYGRNMCAVLVIKLIYCFGLIFFSY